MEHSENEQIAIFYTFMSELVNFGLKWKNHSILNSNIAKNKDFGNKFLTKNWVLDAKIHFLWTNWVFDTKVNSWT